MITLSMKVPDDVRARLERIAKRRKTTPSALLRAALERILESEPAPESCYAACADLFDDLGAGPRDLSSNKDHLRGFGT